MSTFGWETHTGMGKKFPKELEDNLDGALLAFDFDGTLSHMNDDPEAVTMVEATAKAIGQLAGKGVRVAIVSGRPVDALVRLGELEGRPGFENAVLLGQYGVERLDMRTGEKRDPAPPSSIGEAKAELEGLIEQFPGVHLEDKGRALGVHTRTAPNPQETLEEMEEQLRDVAERHDLKVEPGRFVWELRDQAADKGDALSELVEEFHPKVVMMAGDDLGDIAAFNYLDSLQDVFTVKVVSGSKEQPEVAETGDVVCDGPDGLAAWLMHVARQV